MSSQLPESGLFADFTFHEMLVKLIRSRFSGSVELESETAHRVFHFDSGSLCAASSTHPEEQLDRVLERKYAALLDQEKDREVQKRVADGQPFGKALVDLGIISAFDLLKENRTLTEVALEGALREPQSEYRMSHGKAGNYNRVTFDPLDKVKRSVCKDLDMEVINGRLGGPDTAFATTDPASRDALTVEGDSEIKLVLARLGGRSPVSKLAERVGLSADRTKRILFFLKIINWVEPIAAARPDISDAGDSPLVRAAPGVIHAYRAADTASDENDDILRLLDDGPTKDEILAEEEFEDSLRDELARVGKLKRQKAPPQPEAAPAAMLRIPAKTWKLALPALFSGLVFITVFYLLTAHAVENTADDDEELSYYTNAHSEAGAKLPENFIRPLARDRGVLEIRLENGTLGTPGADSADGAIPTNEAEQDAASQEQGESGDTGDASSRRTTDLSSMEDVQREALRLAGARRWREAANLWIKTQETHGPGYTLLIYTSSGTENLEDVFENFANSWDLRMKFFLVAGPRQSNSYQACWGIYKTRSAAEKAIASLSERIRAYNPKALKISSLLE